MTVNVRRGNESRGEFVRFADHYIKRGDGSPQVIGAGSALPESHPAGSWSTVSGDGTRERRRIVRHGSTAGSLTATHAAADNAQLRAGVDNLAGLVSGALGLHELLSTVATFGVQSIPGAEGAGVTLLKVDQQAAIVEASAASAAFVTGIDEIQYTTVGEGPAITAVLEQRTVRSGSLGGEKMWPRFGPRVGRLGVHSVLSLPLVLPDGVIGAISFYAHGKDVFSERAAELGELFAKPAAVAVHNAHLLTHAVTLADQLMSALSTRAVIDQAIGLIRGRSGQSVEDAFAHLRAISQAEHRKLADVAERVVEEAVRRARARHEHR